MIIEPMPRGIKRMRQCLTAALMLGLFSGSVVAESTPSWQGKEPYEIMDPWKLIQWQQKTPGDHPCIHWLEVARGTHKELTEEDGKSPEYYRERYVRAGFPEGSVGYVLRMLATDATLSGKSVQEVGKRVWEKCQEYDPDYVVSAKDPNPKKK